MGFEGVLSHPLMYALGWALFHFIWQGAIVASLVTIALFALKSHTANLRYSIALGAMLLMPVLMAATTWSIWVSSPEMATYSHPVSNVMSVAPRSKPAVWEWSLDHSNQVEKHSAIGLSDLAMKTTGLASLPPWFVSAWLVGVLAFSLRLVFGWTNAQFLKRRSTTFVISHWQERLLCLCEKMKVTRPIRLLQSTLVQVPTTIGWLRPVILLPASSFTGLTPRQLESILAHELAHIRRYDYLFNLLQTGVGTVLFYHPAVWWLSNRVRIERERCCDELAVKVCGDTLTYARALTALEQLRDIPPQLAMAASGGSLLHRIRHIIDSSATQSDFPTWQVVGAFVIITIFTVGVTAHLSGALTGALRHKSGQVCQQTAYTPGRIGNEAAILALTEILRDGSEQVRLQAAYALGRIPNKAVAPVLIEALGDKSERVRQRAAYALGKIGDKAAVPALTKALRDESEQVRRYAAEALNRIKKDRKRENGKTRHELKESL